MGNYFLYRIAYWITRTLPVKGAYAFSLLIADCHYLLSKKDRKAVEENLKVILKEDAVDPAMVREVFRNFGRYLTDFFTQTKRVNTDFIRDLVRIEHIEHLNDALKQGKGCLLVSAHLGNWELAGAVLGKLEYPISIIALVHQDPRVNQFFNDQREFFGNMVIPTTTAVRRCIEQLHSNRVVAILADRDFSQNGIVMDFLGKPTSMPKGAAMFALKTGAPIILIFFSRQAEGGFHVFFSPPIHPPKLGKNKITEKNVADMIGRYKPMIEEQIRANPTQWLLFREFWKS